MAYKECYRDAKSNPVAIGDRVMMADWEPGKYGLTKARAHGIITAISDPDGDMNEYGMMIGIPPQASVQFDDGDKDKFSFHQTSQNSDFMCEDIEKVETVCAYCNQAKGHSKRCSVTKFNAPEMRMKG